MGLVREKLPGVVTAVYLTLAVSTLVYAFRAQGRDGGDWELLLMILTFPQSFVLLFLYGMSLLPPIDNRWIIAWLFLVFMITNAFAINHVCRNIFRED